MTTNQQAAERIAELRAQPFIPPRSDREDLDGPVDPDIRVTPLPNWGHKLELMVAGLAVSQVNVVDFRQQIGSATVRMGGLGDVRSHDEHRFKGYSRRVIENALRWMRRNGYDTGMLYGIPRFYPKYGFAEAFPNVSFSISVRDGESVAPAGFQFVDYVPQHLAALLKMYHANNAGRTGPTLRDAKTWKPWRKGSTWGSKSACRVAVDRAGAPVGYYVHDLAHLTALVIEVGWARPAVMPDILRSAARLAWDQRLEQVRFQLPEDDRFIDFCKSLGLRQETGFRKDGGGMVRIIHVLAALAASADELASRMRSGGTLTIRTNLDDVRLRWSAGRMTVKPAARGEAGPTVRMPQWALAQLLYGYRHAEVLAAQGAIKASARGRAVLEQMFPPRPHFHYAVDYF